MHNLFNSRFSAKPAHEQAQHSEEKCLCRTFWKISLDLGWPEETQRAVCERERKKKKRHRVTHPSLWTCRLFTLWIDVTQSLIPVGYALPLPCSIRGCVLKQCKLRKVTQNRGNKPALFTSHPTPASSPLFMSSPSSFRKPEIDTFSIIFAQPPFWKQQAWGSGSQGRWSRWHCSLWASDKFDQFLRLWLLICRVNRAMTECLLCAKCLKICIYANEKI